MNTYTEVFSPVLINILVRGFCSEKTALQERRPIWLKNERFLARTQIRP